MTDSIWGTIVTHNLSCLDNAVDGFGRVPENSKAFTVSKVETVRASRFGALRRFKHAVLVNIVEELPELSFHNSTMPSNIKETASLMHTVESTRSFDKPYYGSV